MVYLCSLKYRFLNSINNELLLQLPLQLFLFLCGEFLRNNVSLVSQNENNVSLKDKNIILINYILKLPENKEQQMKTLNNTKIRNCKINNLFFILKKVLLTNNLRLSVLSVLSVCYFCFYFP